MYGAPTLLSFTSNQPPTRDMQPTQAGSGSNINHAYVALQSSNANPVRKRLTGFVDTKRPMLSDKQKAHLYLKSIKGNPDIAINKPPRMVSKERVEARLPTVLQNAWAKAPLHRNVEMGCYDGGSQLKRNVAEGNAALGTYTNWQSGHGYEEYVWCLEDFTLYSVEDDASKQYYKFDTVHNPAVAFIGPSPVCGVDHVMLIELSLIDELRKHYQLDMYTQFHVFTQIPELSRPAGCSWGSGNLGYRCVDFTAGDQIEKIEEFLHSAQYPSNIIIFAEPDVIEAWGTTSKYLQEQNRTAFAIRRKNWRMVKYGYPSLGAAVGMGIIGGIVFKCREQVTGSANAVRQAVKRCFGCLPSTEADDPAGDADKNGAVIGTDDSEAQSRELRRDASDNGSEEKMEVKPQAIEKTNTPARKMAVRSDIMIEVDSIE